MAVLSDDLFANMITAINLALIECRMKEVVDTDVNHDKIKPIT